MTSITINNLLIEIVDKIDTHSLQGFDKAYIFQTFQKLVQLLTVISVIDKWLPTHHLFGKYLCDTQTLIKLLKVASKCSVQPLDHLAR